MIGSAARWPYCISTWARVTSSRATARQAIQRISQAVAYDSTLLKADNLLGALYHEQGDLTMPNAATAAYS